MRKIKLFENFDASSQPIQEGKEFYVERGYITDPSVNDKAELEKLVMDNVNKAFVDFAKEFDIPVFNPKITLSDKYLKLTADDIKQEDMGVFTGTFKRAAFGFFNGGQIESAEVDGEFMFQPLIWVNLHLKWEHHSGGTNGGAYVFSESDRGNEMWYSVLDKKFVDIEGARELESKYKK